MGAYHRFAGGFAGAQPRLAKIAQYIAIFRLTAVAPYLSLRSVRRGRVPQPTVMMFCSPVSQDKFGSPASRDVAGIQPPGLIFVEPSCRFSLNLCILDISTNLVACVR